MLTKSNVGTFTLIIFTSDIYSLIHVCILFVFKLVFSNMFYDFKTCYAMISINHSKSLLIIEIMTNYDYLCLIVIMVNLIIRLKI